MARLSDIFWVPIGLLILALTTYSSHGQTNAAPQWLSHDASATSTSQIHRVGVTEVTAVDDPNPDISRFFEAYRQAVAQVSNKKLQDAAITMDLASRNISTSPWLELCLLKHAQLVELTNDRVAEQDYTLLRQRLENAPYFKGDTDRAKLFGVALQGTVDNGINRLRLQRVKEALSKYHARYAEYPESLAKLAILSYTDMENIHTVNNQLFQYVPQSPKLNPFISYQRYELESIDGEPFVANSPKLEATSQLSEKPLKYTAVMHLPGSQLPYRIVENQTVQGFFVTAVTHDGAIVSTPNRVLVLVGP